jgi:ubiquinone/menaquinone biosynthesis C-methylase UbiE
MQESEFDKFAEEYHNTLAKSIRLSGEDPSYFYQYKVELTARITRARQIRVERILDFGSGVGNCVPFFLERFPEARLSCADVSRRSLEVSEKRFSGRIEHSEIKGKELPFADGQFDLVFSACVFHHIDHAEHAVWLTELCRVCRPGGLCIVFEHNPWNPLTLRIVRDCPFDEDAHLITAPVLRRSLLNSGWRQPEIFYTIFFPRQLAFMREAEKLLRSIPFGAQYAVTAVAPSRDLVL